MLNLKDKAMVVKLFRSSTIKEMIKDLEARTEPSPEARQMELFLQQVIRIRENIPPE